MKQLDNRIITLPKSAYRLLNPPPPPRRVVLATAALIIITALLWAIL
jgi:hypothetical protein